MDFNSWNFYESKAIKMGKYMQYKKFKIINTREGDRLRRIITITNMANLLAN